MSGMDMVERVARAICIASGGSAASYDQAFGPSRTMYLAMAAAAIEAMREPNEAMIVAAVRFEPFLSGAGLKRRISAGYWEAMVDAALEKTTA